MYYILFSGINIYISTLSPLWITRLVCNGSGRDDHHEIVQVVVERATAIVVEPF